MKKLITIFMSLIMVVSVATSTTAFATDNTSNDSDEMCKIYYSYYFHGGEYDVDLLTNPTREVKKGEAYTTNINLKSTGKEDPDCIKACLNVKVILADGTIITPFMVGDSTMSILIPEVTDDVYIHIDSKYERKDDERVTDSSSYLFVWNLNNVVCEKNYYEQNENPKGGDSLYQLGTKNYSPKEGYKITSIKLIRVDSCYNELTGKFTYDVEDCTDRYVHDNGDGTYKVSGYGTACSFYLEINAEPIEKPTEPTKPVVKNTTVKLAKSKANLYVKGTTNIKATVKNGKGKTTYKSSNPKVAKVNSNGKFTAIKKGTAKITVTNNKVSKVFTVTVKNPKLNKTSLALKKNKSYTLKVTGKVGKATFSTSNKKVATVNQKGKVVAKKKGKATITVKTNGMKLKCTVNVK